MGQGRRRPAGQGPSNSYNPQQQQIQCPLCGRHFAKSVIEVHASNCEGQSDSSPDEPKNPQVKMPVQEPPNLRTTSGARTSRSKPQHSTKMTATKTSSTGSTSGSSRGSSLSSGHPRPDMNKGLLGLVECPICNQNYDKSVIEEHAANCGEEVYV